MFGGLGLKNIRYPRIQSNKTVVVIPYCKNYVIKLNKFDDLDTLQVNCNRPQIYIRGNNYKDIIIKEDICLDIFYGLL